MSSMSDEDTRGNASRSGDDDDVDMEPVEQEEEEEEVETLDGETGTRIRHARLSFLLCCSQNERESFVFYGCEEREGHDFGIHLSELRQMRLEL